MLDIKEVEWAISELEKAESSFTNFSKLADLYAIRDRIINGNEQNPEPVAMSYALAAAQNDAIESYGDSEFLQSIAGKPSAATWAVIDELMDTLSVVNPRVYNNVMRKLRQI